jgi:cell division septal protein FtsQ
MKGGRERERERVSERERKRKERETEKRTMRKSSIVVLLFYSCFCYAGVVECVVVVSSVDKRCQLSLMNRVLNKRNNENG